MAHFMTAPIRWRTRLAVTRLAFQIGESTVSTSAVVIVATDLRPILGNAYVARDERHCFSDLPLSLHVSAWSRITMSAASSKVGTTVRRLVRGSPPVRAIFRFACAAARASLGVVHFTEPSPMSTRFPWTVSRWT